MSFSLDWQRVWHMCVYFHIVGDTMSGKGKSALLQAQSEEKFADSLRVVIGSVCFDS